MSHREYMRLLSPGVEWLLRCLGDYGALADNRALPLPTADELRLAYEVSARSRSTE